MTFISFLCSGFVIGWKLITNIACVISLLAGDYFAIPECHLNKYVQLFNASMQLARNLCLCLSSVCLYLSLSLFLIALVELI